MGRLKSTHHGGHEFIEDVNSTAAGVDIRFHINPFRTKTPST